jgi:D-glucosaminate-6-phosphate ammonia-lyase
MSLIKRWFGKGVRKLSRRDLFRNSGLVAAAGLSGNAAAPALAAPTGPSIYESIGVRPVINCWNVMTIIGGTLTLPEVKRAMDEASRYNVNLDELAEAVGKKLSELTGAEWGLVTSGCAAAMAHATAACITGGDPEKLQRLPDLTGLKNEVIAPSRNVYDHAVRMLGVRMIDVRNKEEYEAAFSPRTAMVYTANNLLRAAREFNLEVICQIAKQRGVPVLVDAAADGLTIPNVFLEAGATLVAYSGGKRLNGPQCAGLLLGRKDLVRAAGVNSAPHHSFGRPMKVGKEEVMGMLAAVEAWVKRDHAAEQKQWQSWSEHIAARISKVPGIDTELVNNGGQLRIAWDGARVGMTAAELHKALLDGNPRIITPPAGARAAGANDSLTLMTRTISPGDEEIVAQRLYTLFSNPPKFDRQSAPAAIQAAAIGGQWTARLEFVAGSAEHTFVFEQDGNQIRGLHKGQFLFGDLRGYVDGNKVVFRSSQKYEGTFLNYEFTGIVDGTGMQGIVTDMNAMTDTRAEYGGARWTAHRHQYVEPRGALEKAE